MQKLRKALFKTLNCLKPISQTRGFRVRTRSATNQYLHTYYLLGRYAYCKNQFLKRIPLIFTTFDVVDTPTSCTKNSCFLHNVLEEIICIFYRNSKNAHSKQVVYLLSITTTIKIKHKIYILMFSLFIHYITISFEYSQSLNNTIFGFK